MVHARSSQLEDPRDSHFTWYLSQEPSLYSSDQTHRSNTVRRLVEHNASVSDRRKPFVLEKPLDGLVVSSRLFVWEILFHFFLIKCVIFARVTYISRGVIIHSIGYKQFTFEWKVNWRIEKQMSVGLKILLIKIRIFIQVVSTIKMSTNCIKKWNKCEVSMAEKM